MQPSRTLTLYVVQKAWFSGPKVFDPIDYQRLFVTIESAQILAYQSAHALSHQQPGATGPSPVRTLPLDGGYGFAVAGAIFWIRPVTVAVMGSYSSFQNQYTATAICWHNTIGTSRQRRRMQVQQQCDEACVFCGDLGWEAAQNVCKDHPEWQLRSIPVGPAAGEDWQKEWPGDAITGSGVLTNNVCNEEPLGKRQSLPSENVTSHEKLMDWGQFKEEQQQPAKKVCVRQTSINGDNLMSMDLL